MQQISSLKVRASVPALSLGLQSPCPKPRGRSEHQAARSLPLRRSPYTVDIQVPTREKKKKKVLNKLKCSDLILHAAASCVAVDILLFLY